MSVSSHLTPEPERRLWIILENMRAEADRADKKIAALTALAFAEAVYVKAAAPAGPLEGAALILLCLCLILGVAAFAPLRRPRAGLGFLEPSKDKPGADIFVSAEDLAKHPLGELINKLDRYLGGGITATQYYEDIVGEALLHARSAVRKQKLLRALFAVAWLAQLALAGPLLSPRP